MFKKLFTTTLLLAATALSTSVSAAVIGSSSEGGQVSISDKATSTNLYEVFHSIIFPQFDEQGGNRTLTSVVLEFVADSSGTLTWTNTSEDTPTTPSSRVNSVLALSTNQNGTSTLFELLAGGFTGIQYSPGLLGPQASDSVIVPDSDLSVSDTLTITNSSSEAWDLSEFVGTGNMTAYLSSIVSIITNTSGTFNVSGMFSSDAVINYTYFYNINDEIVEASSPSTVAILGLALFVVGFSVRRKS